MCQLCTRCLCRLPPWQDQQPQQLWQLLPSRSCASNSSSHSRSASGPQDKLVCCHPGARITLHTPCPACNYCVVATKTCADCQMHLTHELLLIFKCIYSAEGIIFTTVCGQSVCGPNRYTSEEQPKIAESLFTTRLVEAFCWEWSGAASTSLLSEHVDPAHVASTKNITHLLLLAGHSAGCTGGSQQRWRASSHADGGVSQDCHLPGTEHQQHDAPGSSGSTCLGKRIRDAQGSSPNSESMFRAPAMNSGTHLAWHYQRMTTGCRASLGLPPSACQICTKQELLICEEILKVFVPTPWSKPRPCML